jgi:hypothetical protein
MPQTTRRCTRCDRPLTTSAFLTCETCRSYGQRYYATHRLAVLTKAAEKRWEHGSAPLVGCCHAWHPIWRIPWALPCCGRVLAMWPEKTP